MTYLHLFSINNTRILGQKKIKNKSAFVFLYAVIFSHWLSRYSERPAHSLAPLPCSQTSFSLVRAVIHSKPKQKAYHKDRLLILVGLTGLTSFHFVAPALIALTATAILSSRFRLWSNQLLAGSSSMLSHSRHKKTAIKAVFVSWSD